MNLINISNWGYSCFGVSSGFIIVYVLIRLKKIALLEPTGMTSLWVSIITFWVIGFILIYKSEEKGEPNARKV